MGHEVSAREDCDRKKGGLTREPPNIVVLVAERVDLARGGAVQLAVLAR